MSSGIMASRRHADARGQPVRTLPTNNLHGCRQVFPHVVGENSRNDPRARMFAHETSRCVMSDHSHQPDVQSLSAIGWSFASLTTIVALIATFLVLGDFNPTALQHSWLDVSSTVR